MTTTANRLDEFRTRRRELEAAVLPLATSVDGRRFEFQASLHGLELGVGGYVALDEEEQAAPRTGQVLALEIVEVDVAGEHLRLARGVGVLLDGPRTPFHDARVYPASSDRVRAHLERTAARRAQLSVGELVHAPGLPARLDAGGFDRHTFLCGQSGSGKTYGLGVVLDQLLLSTDLRIVILDPNSDFARLTETHPRAPEAEAERWRRDVAPRIAVRGSDAEGAARLRLRFGELDAALQAALLRLDPIDDAEQYATLAEVVAEARPEAVEDLLSGNGSDERVRLGLRLRNLGVDRLAVWARGDAGSVLDDLRDPDVRCLVVDLGSLATREEQGLVGAAVLDQLWQTRATREPVLVVVDEAHNVCPAAPGDALTAAATRTAVAIAAEGRKFGLYLLVSTQRPQKVDANVLSQCDNLILMRLNSDADGAFAREAFSFVPAGLVALAPAFGQGEALVAGKMAPHPALVRFGARVSAEGGADVSAAWATAR
jgi:DNA helicase HerA-like ATPase